MKDRTPEGDRQNAALPSGEVFGEYGIVDMNHSFPSEDYRWDPGPMEAEEEHYVVVPFRVVKRGFKSRTVARDVAERMEEEGHGSYKVVQLSDMRGI